MAKLITQSQFARRIKLTRGRISQLVKQGIILLTNGRVDPVQAENAIRNKVDRRRQLDLELKSQPQKQSSLITKDLHYLSAKTGTAEKSENKPSPVRSDSNGLSLTEVRRDHELLKAELTGLQLQIKKGELVPKEEQIKWLIALGSAAKLAFQGLPRRLAPIVRFYDDEKKIEVIIRDEIYKIIRELEKPLNAANPRKPKRTDPR